MSYMLILNSRKIRITLKSYYELAQRIFVNVNLQRKMREEMNSPSNSTQHCYPYQVSTYKKTCSCLNLKF